MPSGFTLKKYEELKAAILEGVLTVEYDGKKVTYRSLDEMIRILNMAAIELGLSDGRGRRIYHSTSKGTDSDRGSCDE